MRTGKELNEFIISETSTLIEAIEKIAHNKMRAVVVVANGKLIGVASEGDILRALLHGSDIHAQIGPVMQYTFKYLFTPDYQEAFRLFRKYLITLLPIVDNKMHLKGLVTLPDVLSRVKVETEAGKESSK